MDLRKGRKGYLIFGIALICVALFFLIRGLNNYIQQFGQSDWELTTATVTNVEERVEKTSMKVSPTLRHRWTYYDISYQYEVNGNVYTNTIYGSNKAKQHGDFFDIKYDPENPQNSTQYLEPTSGVVVSGFIGFVVWGAIGLRIMKNSLPSKKRKKARNPKKCTPTNIEKTDI